ncbi:MAG: hypothetical protein ACK5XN_24765 [Bacteroidota bacterium]|jgi:hypothetical protein
MENWEVELVKALKEAENKTESSQHVAAKWRLVDQALRPHRRWMLLRVAAAAVVFLVSVAGLLYRTFPVNKSPKSHPIATMVAPRSIHQQPNEPSKDVERKPNLMNKVKELRMRNVLALRTDSPAPLPARSFSDTSVEPELAVTGIAMVSESSRRRPGRRTGTSLFLEGFDTVKTAFQPSASKPALAKRKQGTRSGWVTQIRF